MTWRLICSLAVLAVVAFAESEFEVVSVRPMEPSRGGEVIGLARGGPGSADPETIVWRGAAPITIFRQAFGYETYQVIGPDWMTAGPADLLRFDITAKVPPGATRDEVSQMWLNVMKTRFGAEWHQETRQTDVYALRVAAGGARLKVAPVRESGNGQMMILSPLPGGAFRVRSDSASMATLASVLRRTTAGTPVLDQTALVENFEFQIEFAGTGPVTGDGEPLPSLFTVLKQDLGLELVKTKAPISVVVIDKISKSPTPN